MQRSNPDNIWKLISRTGEEFYVKCPSKSGAKIFLAEKLGDVKKHCPFKSELYLKEQVPEGAEILQAKFRSAFDPENWAEGKI